MKKHRLAIGVTGASGAIYAKVMFDRLMQVSGQLDACGVVFSQNAKDVWEYELGNRDFEDLPFKIYGPNDFFAPFASGSAGYTAMIVCPCSMGTMGRIASGISNDLMTRAADVMLKERRKLVLVARDTPLSLIHINNMRTVTEAGGIIAPASPSFYSRPKDFEELALTVVDRALVLAGIELEGYRWGDADAH
ncbi:MAG: UbiX family flavin prenyltransferase [Flavobacteriales bacterium]|nr:UbiX family flavin prenyltransferase [Flavobacteriales bacterium]